MKIRIIAFLLAAVITCASICSCTYDFSNHAVALASDPIELRNLDYDREGYNEFKEKLVEFSAALTDKIYKEYGQNENIVISPISIYMALALACECANGETRQEILDAVGVTYEEVSNFTKILYAYANVDYNAYTLAATKQVVAYQELTNSIWLDDSVPFVEDGVNKLASEYNCDVFKASFKNGDAEKLINRYIKEKSRGLLEGDVDFSPETYFVLMNTYYLKEIWNEWGKDLKFTDSKYDFTNNDGSIKSEKLLIGYYQDGKAYEGEGFTSFFTDTDHGFSIYFFVPDDGYSINDIFDTENISTVLQLKNWGAVDDENMQYHYTRVLFPEFEADFSQDIESVLNKDFGIRKLFDKNECDMSNVSVDPVYCEGVIHKASLKVDKSGIEGAAVTIMPAAGASGPPPYEKVYHDYAVDRAFGFVITDSYGTVIFSGIINSIN